MTRATTVSAAQATKTARYPSEVRAAVPMSGPDRMAPTRRVLGVQTAADLRRRRDEEPFHPQTLERPAAGQGGSAVTPVGRLSRR
ncbi:hypothetical protein Voc01_053840 [Virgisporangium ochraceum]|uniref:Uncharacterized protein n=1 Tax=Virgisporangium ochraceum TaxID=65505 RepID=A0A8J4EFU8_9ACTN|nr:hypothetical protein Voc01_053840 [Virgisporangium ochraceum]